MENCWIIVADSTRARLFRHEPGQHIHEFEDLLNPDARLKEQDLVSDSAGRGLNRSRASRFAMSEPVSHRELAEKEFAHRIAQFLVKARKRGDVQKLHMVAAPRFLGLLRAGLDDDTRAIIASETRKSVVRLDTDALRALLPEYL
jgi:protein required for attachment to host cells